MEKKLMKLSQSKPLGKVFVRKLSVLSMAVLILFSCFLLPSCTSKGMQRQKMLDKPLDDNYIARIAEIRKNKKKLYGDGVTNSFLYCMDVGVLFHYAGMFDSSNVYLLEAGRIFDDLFTKSVSNEAAAVLTNDNVRPYRSKPYELTVLHQLVAFNFMAMGKFDEALVESRNMQIYFNEWERTGAKDKKYHTDGMFHLFSSLAYERAGETDNSLISLFQSAAAFRKGPVALAPEVEGFAYDRLKAGDREDDIGLLNLRPDNGPNKWTAAMGDAEIVIVGYAGKGPKMIEQNWSGTITPGGNLYITTPSRNGGNLTYSAIAPPIPDSHRNSVGSGTTHHVKISLPELVTTPARVDRFSAWVEGGDRQYMSVVVNDIDLQAKKELEDNFGTIVARTMIRTLIRTVLAEQSKKRVDTGSPLGNLAFSIAADIATDQMEKADVRMCFMLPQRIVVTRIPVQPGTHTVQMNVHDRSGAVIGRKAFSNIEVKKGEKKVLFDSYFL